MKIKKSIILMIALLFPLIITSFVGLYMYGYVGNWTNNQEKFKETMFSPDVETSTSLDNYLKINYQNYIYNKDNFKVFDYGTQGFSNNGTLLNNENGIYQDSNDGYNIQSVTVSTINDGVSHPFFLTNINHNNVTPKNVVMLVIQYDKNDVEGSYEKLERAFNEFEDEYVNGETKGSTGLATTAGTVSGTYPVYDKHALTNVDDTNTNTPFIVRITPNRSFSVYELENGEPTNTKEESISYNKLENALFTVVECFSDSDENYYEVKALCYGEINNICATGTQVAQRENAIKGITVVDNELKSLENAGYFAYIWPTILWQSAIALVISGLLAFFFYKTWTIDEENKDEKLTKTKKKVKSNKVIDYFKNIFTSSGWFIGLFIVAIAALISIQAVSINILDHLANKYVTLFGLFTGIIILCLAILIYLCIKNLKFSSARRLDQTLFSLNCWWLIIAIYFIIKGFDNYLLYLWIIVGVISITFTILRILYASKQIKAKEESQEITSNNYFKSLLNKYGYVLPIFCGLVIYLLLMLADLMGIFYFIINADTVWFVIDIMVILFLIVYLPLISISELKNKQLSTFDLMLFVFDIITVLLGITFVLVGGHVLKYILWIILLVVAVSLTSTRLQKFSKK